MPAPAPQLIVEAFATSGARNTIPVPSQIAVTPGKASYTDGFPPLNMTPLPSGGIPPSGKDMNGILFAVSSYLAWIQGGGQFYYSAAFVTQNTGYAVGAILRSASDATKLWRNTVADNALDPDVTPTGWVAITEGGGGAGATGLQSSSIAAGTVNNLACPNTVGFLDVLPNAGNSLLTGVAAGANGQFLTITNMHASNLLTIASLNAGSTAANRFRLATDLTLLQFGSLSFRYSASLTVWVPV